MEKKWNEAKVAQQILENYNATGRFPTCSFLKESGQNALSCEIVRTGGFLKWSERLGISRQHSDSDTGWSGEIDVAEILKQNGLESKRSENVKWPFDLLVEGVLRVDVKTAKYATYGHCSGWFFRIGKTPQADLIALYQSDDKSIHWIPWNMVPSTNVTITKTGKTYSCWKNNMELVRSMASSRKRELESFQCIFNK